MDGIVIGLSGPRCGRLFGFKPMRRTARPFYITPIGVAVGVQLVADASRKRIGIGNRDRE